MVQGLRIHLSRQRTQVQSLLRELRTHRLWGAARNIIIVKLSNRALKRREKKGKESLLALKMS